MVTPHTASRTHGISCMLLSAAILAASLEAAFPRSNFGFAHHSTDPGPAALALRRAGQRAGAETTFLDAPDVAAARRLRGFTAPSARATR